MNRLKTKGYLIIRVAGNIYNLYKVLFVNARGEHADVSNMSNMSNMLSNANAN